MDDFSSDDSMWEYGTIEMATEDIVAEIDYILEATMSE